MAVPFEHDPTSSTSSATSPESLAGRKGGSSFLGSMFRSTSRDRDRYRNKNKNKEQQKASFDDKSKQDNHPQAPHDKEAEHEETTIPLSRKSSQKPSRPNRLANMVSSKKEVVGAVEVSWHAHYISHYFSFNGLERMNGRCSADQQMTMKWAK